MAKIRKEDIFDPKLFTSTTQEINAMITAIGKLKGQMIDLIKVNKELLQTNKVDSSAGLKRQAEATQKVSQADKNLNALEKERLRLVNKLNQTASAQAKNNQRLKIQIQQRNKAIKDELKTEKQLFGAYARKSAQLAKLRKRYKDLLVAGKGNTKQAKQLAREVQNLDSKLKQVDASAGQYQRNVGNYGSKLKAGFQSLMGAVGLTAGITGAVRGIRSVISVVTDFDSAVANLGAVTQASDEDLAKLRENAIKLSEVTKFTASEVADLSLELGKLGFKPDEIIESSEAILALSAATGQELAESAKITGQTLRAFNLEVEEAGRVASVLGVATTKSGLDMEFFNTAMSKVAPVASSLGFELEETVAMLGTLANAGFDASTAATATKNIFLKLADDSGELAQTLGEPVRSMDDLIPALTKLKEELGEDGLARALELTDKRSVAAFNTFLNNTDTLGELTEGITNVNDELQDMADKQLDTVNGQLQLLNSKWQAMILGASDSAGAVSTLKNAISFITRNLETILRVIKLVTIAFISYKTAVIATNLIVRTYRAVTIGARIATIAFSGGLKGARRAMQLLNTSIKANPIGLLVSVLTTAIALLWDFSDGADDSADSIDRVTEAYERLKKSQENALGDLDDINEKTLALIDKELALAKQRGASEKEIIALQKKRLDTELQGLVDKAKLLQDEADSKFDIMMQDEVQRASIMEFQNRNAFQGFEFTYDQIQARQASFLKQVQEENEAIKKLLPELREKIDKLNKEIELRKISVETRKIELDTQKEINEQNEEDNKPPKANIYQAEKLKLLREELKLAEQLKQLNFKDNIKNQARNADKELQKLYKDASDLEFVDPDGDGDVSNIVLPDTTKYFSILKIKEEEEIKSLRSATDFAFLQEQQKLEDYKKRLNKEVKAEKLSRSQRRKLIVEAEDNLLDKKIQLEQKYTNDVGELQKERVKKEEEVSQDLLEIATATNEGRIKEFEEDIKQDLADLGEVINATNELLNAFQQANNERTRQQLENIDKEIEASKKRYDELKALAIQGNADANKSALFEIRRQEELERQKQKVQRRQQLINAGIAAFKVYGEKVAQGDQNPLASTITDLTALSAFIQSLPTFWEGTENVGDSLGSPLLSGRDGHVVRVDSNERIVDVANNRKMSGISNNELGDLAWSYKNDTLDTLGYNKLGGMSYEMLSNSMSVNYQLNKQLKEINRSNKQIISAIEHIPNESWDYDRMSDAVIQKIKTQKKTEIKHYKNNTLF